MRFIVGPVQTKVSYGGSDMLFGINWEKALREYLRERPDGYNYSEAFKSHVWDGWTYFITTSGYFATGFLPLVIKHVRSLAPTIDIEIRDERKTTLDFYPEYRGLIGNAENWEIRDYQEEVVKLMLSREVEGIPFSRGIVDAATNAGKNSIIANYVHNIRNAKVLFLVDEGLVFRQAIKFFSEMFEVGVIHGNRAEYTAQFVMSTPQTLVSRMKSSTACRAAIAACNVVIIDEAHKASGKRYTDIYRATNAAGVWFFSGTPLDMDDKVAKLKLIGMSSTVIKKITNRELIERGVSQKPIVNIWLHDFLRPGMYRTYEDEQNALYSSTLRMELVRKVLLAAPDKQALLVFNHTRHGQATYDYLIRKGITSVEWTHGEDRNKAQVVDRFSRKEFRILMASMIVKHGLNIHSIGLGFNCQGGKAKITVKQLVGRYIRHDKVSDTVEVHDIFDTGEWCQEHSKKRVKMYYAEGFEVVFHYPAKANGVPKG